MSEQALNKFWKQIFATIIITAILSVAGSYFASVQAVAKLETKIEMLQTQVEKLDTRIYEINKHP